MEKREAEKKNRRKVTDSGLYRPGQSYFFISKRERTHTHVREALTLNPLFDGNRPVCATKKRAAAAARDIGSLYILVPIKRFPSTEWRM